MKVLRGWQDLPGNRVIDVRLDENIQELTLELSEQRPIWDNEGVVTEELRQISFVSEDFGGRIGFYNVLSTGFRGPSIALEEVKQMLAGRTILRVLTPFYSGRYRGPEWVEFLLDNGHATYLLARNPLCSVKIEINPGSRAQT
jgi:hypothetical protein